MNQFNRGDHELDALAGMISPTGRGGEFLADAVSQWAHSYWENASGGGTDWSAQLAERLRDVTGHDKTVIATCLPAGSLEDLLQWAIVLCRRRHQSITAQSGDVDSTSDGSAAESRVLCAVGSDHGRGVVGRMASGRADLREPAWPMVPGFVHAPLDSLHQRIDDSTAMVLISPVDLHEQVQPISLEQLIAIREACDRHHAALVIDHRNLPPMGGGHFWIQDSIASVTADAVMMSAGLNGGCGGGVLALNSALAEQIQQLEPADAGRVTSEQEMPLSPQVAVVVDATLQQWMTLSWQSTELDSLATSLAERLARRESVRDLHVTGRSIGIELDLPSLQWAEVAAGFGLAVATAGEFAVRLQPPLIFEADEQSELLDRIDMVFEAIEEEEQRSDEPVAEASPEDSEASEEDTQSETESLDEVADAPSDNVNDDKLGDDESDVEVEEDSDENHDEAFADDELDNDELDDEEIEDEEPEHEELDDEPDEGESESDELEEESSNELEYESDDEDENEEDEDDASDEDEFEEEEQLDVDEIDEDEIEDTDDDEVKRSQFEGEFAESEADDSDSITDPETQS